MVDNIVDIGDTVYIGGLFGKEFEKINNKFGVVLNIHQITIVDRLSSCVYEIDIDGIIETINNSYVYKIENFYTTDYPIHFKYSISNPILFYYKFHEVVGDPQLVINDDAFSFVIAKTFDSDNVYFQLTNIN